MEQQLEQREKEQLGIEREGTENLRQEDELKEPFWDEPLQLEQREIGIEREATEKLRQEDELK